MATDEEKVPDLVWYKGWLDRVMIMAFRPGCVELAARRLKEDDSRYVIVIISTRIVREEIWKSIRVPRVTPIGLNMTDKYAM